MSAPTTTYLVLRGGEIKLRLSGASVDPDGSVHVAGAYVIDGELAKSDGCLPEITAKAKARKWGQINRRYFGKVGASPSGLVLVSEADRRAQEDLTRSAYFAAHPEVAERNAIEDMLDRAERLIQGEDEEYDRGAGYNLKHQAEQRRMARRALTAAWNAAREAEAADRRAGRADGREPGLEAWLEVLRAQAALDKLEGAGLLTEGSILC